MVRCLRNGSSGFRIGDMVKSVPVSFGDQRSMIAPCGKPTKAKRFGVFPAGVSAHAVAAGIMESRSGSPMVAPTPFKTVRRAMCFLDMNMVVSLIYFATHYFRALCTGSGCGTRRILN